MIIDNNIISQEEQLTINNFIQMICDASKQLLRSRGKKIINITHLLYENKYIQKKYIQNHSLINLCFSNMHQIISYILDSKDPINYINFIQEVKNIHNKQKNENVLISKILQMIHLHALIQNGYIMNDESWYNGDNMNMLLNDYKYSENPSHIKYIILWQLSTIISSKCLHSDKSIELITVIQDEMYNIIKKDNGVDQNNLDSQIDQLTQTQYLNYYKRVFQHNASQKIVSQTKQQNEANS